VSSPELEARLLAPVEGVREVVQLRRLLLDGDELAPEPRLDLARGERSVEDVEYLEDALDGECELVAARPVLDPDALRAVGLLPAGVDRSGRGVL
jgi:hypothetical protein